MSSSHDDLDVLVRVSAGTPMGNLLRRFWLPALLVSEVAERDGTPVRIRILGEDLVAFRDSNGRLGIVEAYCPHKLAPLFFGRNEQCGLRCVYHGWKFDVTGACVDIPNVVPPDNYDALRQRMSITSYPVREAGGMIWVYMGPKEAMPELPGMEWLRLPLAQVHASRWLQRSNWVQGLEGEIDTSHISFLHSEKNPSAARGGQDRLWLTRDGAPQITLKETPFGFVYGARRDYRGQYYWRITQWMLPMWSAIPPALDDFNGNGRGWVPIDDYHTTTFGYTYRLDRELNESDLQRLNSGGQFPPRVQRGSVQLPHGYMIDAFLPVANKQNDYLIDRDVQRTKTFTGIWGVNEQDRALQESMASIPGHPGIVDRTRENLVRSDLPTITARKMLVRLARALQGGEAPEALRDPSLYSRRAISVVSPIADFDELMSEYGKRGEGGQQAVIAA